MSGALCSSQAPDNRLQFRVQLEPNHAHLALSRVIRPQAMRSPESPAGSVA